MAKFVIVEWDSQQLRLASTQANGAVEQAWSVPLEDSKPATLAAALKSQIEEHRLQRCEALVSVSRRDVEVRELNIPPSPEEEHPDMVRMLAPREFTQFDDDTVIDFYEIGRRDEMHCMLAASIDGDKLEQILNALKGAHLTPHWLALRPFCAATLLDHDPPAPRLIVDIASEQADISVHNGRQVLSVRNVRLPHENPGAALQRDLKRTMAVATSLLGKSVQEIVMFGSPEEHAALVDNWSLEEPLRFVDPCQASGARLQTSEPGRFASLLGLAHVAQIGGTPWFDFLNPRKRPADKRQLTTPMIAGIAVAVLLIAAGVVMLMNLKSLDNQVLQLSKELQQTKDAATLGAQTVAHRDEVVAFVDSRVNWLGELRRVSEKTLTYSDVTFTKWTGRSVASDAEEGGSLTLDGGAKDAETIGVVQDSLRKDGHGRIVEGRGHTQDYKDKVHPYRFRQLTISIPTPTQIEDRIAQKEFTDKKSAEDAPSTDGAETPPADEPADAPPDDEPDKTPPDAKADADADAEESKEAAADEEVKQ